MATESQFVTEKSECGETKVTISNNHIVINTPWTDKPVKLSITDVDKVAEIIGCEKETAVFINSRNIE